MTLLTMTTKALRRWPFAAFVAAIALAPITASAEKDVPAWKKPAPGTQAFLGDDGGGVNTATVCDTADGFRDWLKYEHPRGCQTFQHDLPVVIEVVTFDPVEDDQGTAGLPIVKVHIPSRRFVGYLQLLSLHPVIPSGTVVHFKKTGNETFELFPTAKIGSVKDKGLDLGDQFSAKVVKYDPTTDDGWDFHVTILDGKYAGQSGWMLSIGAAGEDGIPIDQFSGAVISDERRN